jgi:hypothetical protein
MEDKTYYSYLLRMWRVLRGDELVWLASLDDPHTGKRRSFESLESLFAFLRRQAQEADRQAQSRAEQQCDQDHPSEGTDKK